ncbi:Hachiman antiphage defense system protein HamA [Ralstonia solanacearum]|uniref:Hachiman antiphage defense system protein HamA n=2 Tax=Ralstonia solanacearum species complex TaxID=3116862 RepID=UPI0013A636EE|nr:Hachiman antiphage defense system protein HamA [Ralstonia solanacearum]
MDTASPRLLAQLSKSPSRLCGAQSDLAANKKRSATSDCKDVRVSSENASVVKSFDMVHVRYADEANIELWLGEAKFYSSGVEAVASAIESIRSHIDAGFLRNEKLLLGPQVSKTIPRHEEIRRLLSRQTSLDELFSAAVFPVCIACDSEAVAMRDSQKAQQYSVDVQEEMEVLLHKGLLIFFGTGTSGNF